MAAVFWASFRRRAMVARRRVILTRSSRAASSAGTGARGIAAGAGAAVIGAAAAARATSSFITRPSRPVPWTWAAVKPASSIAFLAEGAFSMSLATGAGAGAALAASTALGAAPTAPSVTMARRAFSASTPETGLGTSTETLSVSSSHSISSCFTVSPGFLNQVETVASETLSPKLGTITSVIFQSPARLRVFLGAAGSETQRRVHQGLLFMFVAARQTRCRGRVGDAACIARTAVLGTDLGQNDLNFRFDEQPRALVLRLFLTPDDLGTLEAREFGGKRFRRNRVKLFDAQQVNIVQTLGIAFGQQVVIDLARTQHHALDLVVGLQFDRRVALLRVVPHHAVEAGAIGEIGGFGHAERVTQQRFRRHQDQRFAEITMQLAAQDVEVVRRRCAVGNDPVVMCGQLQEAFQTGGGVFRPLTFEPVRQQADKARHPQPLRLARVDELVEHDLRAVGEIAELGFPHRQGVGFGQRIAVFEAQHRIFRQHGVDDFIAGLTRTDMVQRVVTLFGGLVDETGMALREGATGAILPCQTDGETFDLKAAKGQSFGGGPIKALAGFEHFGLGIKLAGHGFMQIKTR